MLPILVSQNKNISNEYTIEQQNIVRRNAVIDEFLNSLDNKGNNADELNTQNDTLMENNDEKDEMDDDFFKDIKYLKKIEKHNTNRELYKMRPKFFGKKQLMANIKNINNANELNMDKCSTFSFENELDSKINNDIDKIATPRCATKNNIIEYMLRKNKKEKQLPKIDINNLKFRNTEIDNYFLTSNKPEFINSECNILNFNDMKNYDFKWANRKLLKHINSFYSSKTPLNTYIYNLRNLRSKSHIGNRTEHKNLKIMNKDISNLSPNLIAAQMYKNNSYFNKKLKRNCTAKLNKNISINANKMLSKKNDNKKIFKTIKNKKNNTNNTKKKIINNNSFRKLLNNKNIEMNWMNTIIKNNNKNFKTIKINKKDLSKKQLKLKLAEIEINNKLRNDDKLCEKIKK